MNRRSFLSRSLLSAASYGIGSALPASRRGRFGLQSAEAAPLPTPYPVLAIILDGGCDPAMHMVATPNGSLGGATIANRLPDESSFKTTRTGIRYVSSVVTPVGKTDLEPHLEDLALVRGIRGYGDHNGLASLWFGDSINSGKTYGRLAWASQLTAQFRRRGVFVPKPCAVGHVYNPTLQPYVDYVNWGTESPDPGTLVDRILSLSGYFNSMSSVGLPPPARQTPTNALIATLAQSIPSTSQPDFTARYSAATGTTNEVLRVAAGTPPAWPPSPQTLAALGIIGTLPDAFERTRPEHMFALAFQAFSNNLAHVVAFSKKSFDTHIKNVEAQTSQGASFWPLLGKLVAKMKATQSPIDRNKTLFDTTNIWIQSEMGRSPGGQTVTLPKTGEMFNNGTDHWKDGFGLFLGGRFKRGIAIGGFTPDWTSRPTHPTTGSEAGGIVLRVNNAIATVMKAAGADPSEFTDAAPIDSILDMSL